MSMTPSVFIVYKESQNTLPNFPAINSDLLGQPKDFDFPFPSPSIYKEKDFKIVAVCSNLDKANQYLKIDVDYKISGPYKII